MAASLIMTTMKAAVSKPQAIRGLAAAKPAATARPRCLSILSQARQGDKQAAAQNGGESRAVQATRGRGDGGQLAARRAPLSQLAPDFSPLIPSRVPSLFRDLEDEMNQLLRGFGVGNVLSPATRRVDEELPQLARAALGAVDVRETDKYYEFKVDVPGLDVDDLKISVSPDRVLTIQGERVREDAEPDAEGGFQRLERVYGTFVRRFQLPDNVDVDSIDAKTDNGVLKLTVPKIEDTNKPQHKQIKVNKAEPSS